MRMTSSNKGILLLAVLELAESGDLEANRIIFGPVLFERYQAYWSAIEGSGDGRIYYPFWFLKSSPFWQLVPREGFAETVRKADARGHTASAKDVREWIDHVRLSAPFYTTARAPRGRDALRDLVKRKLERFHPDIDATVAQLRVFETAVYRHTQAMRQAAEARVPYVVETSLDDPTRSAAFRREVLGAYGYACAVTGTRLSLPSSGGDLVQAAHIHDWADSHDDNPRNGLPLTPDFHWMFDRGLFTVDRDLCVYPHRDRLAEADGSVDIVLSRSGQSIRGPYYDLFGPDEAYLRKHWEKHEFSKLLS
jgi:putative restriction endonuclease